MSTYRRLYADYRNSSRIDRTAEVAGRQVWMSPIASETGPQVPECILPVEEGTLVQTTGGIVRQGSDGTQMWDQARDSSMRVVWHEGVAFIRDTVGRLRGFNASGETVLADFKVAACYNRCSLPLVYPKPGGRFLIHTANRAPEVEEGVADPQDDYNLISMGPGGWMDHDFMLEFAGKALPAMVTADGSKVVVLNYDRQVLSFDVTTGKQLTAFVIDDIGFWAASLDNKDRVITVVMTKQKAWKLLCYSLSGIMQWEYELTGGAFSPYDQPPAIDGENRVLFVFGGRLLRLTEGFVDWQLSVDRIAPVHRLTVQGDNTILVASGRTLLHVDNEGVSRMLLELPPGEHFTAPPVVDSQERVVVGSTRGVYCIE